MRNPKFLPPKGVNQQELDEMNFRNMVGFHKEDLVEIMNGAPTADIFTWHRQQRLKEDGILFRCSTGKISPTPEAIAELEAQSSNHKATQDE